jgi:inhibitor of cysteine peptidase
MKKRILTSLTMALTIVCCSAVVSFADETVSYSVEMNGTKLSTPAYDQYGYLYLPLRAVSETLGYTVEWSGKDHTVTLKNAADTIAIDFNRSSVTDGGHQYYGDSQIIDGKAYMSDEFFNDSFGVKVEADAAKRTVSMESVTENSITIENVNETSGNDKIDIELKYPQISGLANQTVQDKLNAFFKGEADAARQEGLTYSVDYPEGMTNKYQTYFDYRVKYNQNDLLSVVLLDYQYMGGAHGSTIQKAYTFDLTTDEEYAMKELFKTGSDYLAPFNSIVKTGIKDRDLFELTTFSAIAADQAYYLDNTGVTVYFQQYEYFPYAAGIQTFRVDYEALADLLNPELGLAGSTDNQTVTVLTEGKDNTLKVGDSCSVTLEGNPTTGYTWQCEIGDDRIVSLTNESSTPDSALIGAGSTFHWTFKALKPGETTVTFRYYRPWEGNANFPQTVEYQIIVK